MLSREFGYLTCWEWITLGVQDFMFRCSGSKIAWRLRNLPRRFAKVAPEPKTFWAACCPISEQAVLCSPTKNCICWSSGGLLKRVSKWITCSIISRYNMFSLSQAAVQVYSNLRHLEAQNMPPFPHRNEPRWGRTIFLQMRMGQNETTRGPQVSVHVSIYQGSMLGLPYF